MNHKRLFLVVAATGAAIMPTVAFAEETTPTTAGVYYKTCADAPYQLHRGDPGYRPALDRDGDGVACEDRPVRPTTTSSTASATTTTSTSGQLSTYCIQGTTVTGPPGATNPTGIPYAQGPCPDDDPPRRTICISGVKTVMVTREEEDTIGEPYTLGPCPVRTVPHYTG